MKETRLLVACLFLLNIARAADEDSLPKKKAPIPSTYRTVYFELGGPAVLYSFNYEQRFKGQHGFGFRAGFSVLPNLVPHSENYLIVPVELNYIESKDGVHFIELGLGVTLGNQLDLNYFNTFTTNQSAGLFSNYTMGYRYQSPRKHGVNFRIFLSPLFENRHSLFWGGISFGRRI